MSWVWMVPYQAGREVPPFGDSMLNKTRHQPGNVEALGLTPLTTLLYTKAGNAGLQQSPCIRSEVIIPKLFLKSAIYLLSCKRKLG